MPLSDEISLPARRGWRALRHKLAAGLAAGIALMALSATPAFAVCEELTFQFFGGYLTFVDSASQPCREFVRLNVANHAYRTTLLEVCQKKRNYSGRYRNEIDKQANKCLDKKSVSWIRKQYNASAAENMRTWKGLTAANPQFCTQKEVRDYIVASQQILQQTSDQAKQYCTK